MFGFGKSVKKTIEVTPVIEDDFESILRLLVENNLTINHYRGVSRYNQAERKKNQSEKSFHETKVSEIANALTEFRRLSSHKNVFAQARKMVESKLQKEEVIRRVTADTYSEKLEAARSRVMIKAIRAGLDRSDAFYGLMDADTVSKVESVERWVERTDAYKAIVS